MAHDETARPTRFLMEDAGPASDSDDTWDVRHFALSTGNNGNGAAHTPTNASSASAVNSIKSDHFGNCSLENSSVCLQLTDDSVFVSSTPSGVMGMQANTNAISLGTHLEIQPPPLPGNSAKCSKQKRTVATTILPISKRFKQPKVGILATTPPGNAFAINSVMKKYSRADRTNETVTHEKPSVCTTNTISSTLSCTSVVHDSGTDQPTVNELHSNLGSIVNCYEIKPKNNSGSLGVVPAMNLGKTVGISVDGHSSSLSKSEQSNHTKIICEILKKYPNLVRDKKNLKFKIMRKGSCSAEISADAQQYIISSQNKLGALTKFASLQKSTVNASKLVKNSCEFKCTDCVETQSTYALLKQHVLQQHKLCSIAVLERIEANLLRCTLCLEKPNFFTDRASLEFHDMEMHNKELRWCRMCGYKPIRKLDLAYHMFIEHKVEPPRSVSFPKCDVCKFVAVNQRELLKHRSDHPANDSFKCHTCSVTFRSFGALQGHLQAKACNRKQSVSHNCPHCSQTFSKSYNLKVHIRSQHKNITIRSETQSLPFKPENADDLHKNASGNTFHVGDSVQKNSCNAKSAIETLDNKMYSNAASDPGAIMQLSTSTATELVQPLKIYSTIKNHDPNYEEVLMSTKEDSSNVMYEEIVTTPLENVSYEEIVECTTNNIADNVETYIFGSDIPPDEISGGSIPTKTLKTIHSDDAPTSLNLISNSSTISTGNDDSSQPTDISFPVSILPNSLFPEQVMEVVTGSPDNSAVRSTLSTDISHQQPVVYFAYQLPSSSVCSNIGYVSSPLPLPSITLQPTTTNTAATTLMTPLYTPVLSIDTVPPQNIASTSVSRKNSVASTSDASQQGAAVHSTQYENIRSNQYIYFIKD